ncbi:hypothetical protein CDAR_300751 [Caerostris darwini]|uniref:Uncharacterized protein n=1 Tax=Caerostris darwini TaxID=1538125 RepID=A0AAV4U8P3_9ARAC|nr:hypothetical protein CDAR_300751 [Caerostris darwini]
MHLFFPSRGPLLPHLNIFRESLKFHALSEYLTSSKKENVKKKENKKKMKLKITFKLIRLLNTLSGLESKEDERFENRIAFYAENAKIALCLKKYLIEACAFAVDLHGASEEQFLSSPL